jgi:hypothetical protein
MDLHQFIEDMTEFATVASVGEVVFVGGEPLLHPWIMEFLRFMRASAFASSISVFTNGLLVPKMSREFYAEARKIAVSCYPGVDGNKVAAALKGQPCSVEYYPRPTMREINKTTPDDGVSSFNQCQIANVWRCHSIHNGYYYKCSRPPVTNAWLKRQGQPPYQYEKDGIAIHEPGLEKRLTDYLSSKTPLEACKWCYGTSGQEVPWKALA